MSIQYHHSAHELVICKAINKEVIFEVFIVIFTLMTRGKELSYYEVRNFLFKNGTGIISK